MIVKKQKIELNVTDEQLDRLHKLMPDLFIAHKNTKSYERSRERRLNNMNEAIIKAHYEDKKYTSGELKRRMKCRGSTASERTFQRDLKRLEARGLVTLNIMQGVVGRTTEITMKKGD